MRVIDVDDVHWIAANGNYVDIHHCDGQHLLRASLKQVLASLPDDRFVQVHRSYVVRFDLVQEVKTKDGERSEVSLSCGANVPVGKSFRQALVRRLCR